ncbi:protein GrpE [Alicyclobacillus contaminans]|uniref:nucleotide exchange factor GrpE n=1 Tax=Alicyclobacillus contaminans TaxID=392016 RepID=UPI0003F751E3|nr:nucleotide exchange factor GrpE [Alicyclobacillus contaminans]GMA52144.1 protein GrpE [Alicyclobacillus contaminans]
MTADHDVNETKQAEEQSVDAQAEETPAADASGETSAKSTLEASAADTEAAEGGDGDAPEAAVSALERELEEVKGQLLRVHADFDNFRRRTRQEKEDLQRFATKAVVSDVLGVVDNLERALASVPEDEAVAELRKGIEMVYRQLVSVLEKHGVQAMNTVGASFDPTLHEAVMQAPAEEGQTPGTVVEELQKGYMLNGKVLRPAMVKVTV